MLKTKNATVIEEKMGNINQEDFNFDRYINYEHLFAAAYFYSPDISKIACWRRRVFSSGKKRKHLKDLKLLFENYSKEEVLGKLHKKILEKTCLYLNKKSKFKKFELKKTVKKEWIIDLTDRYAEKIFYRFHDEIKKNSIIDKKNKDEIKKNFFSIFVFAIGQSSFVYWILTFIFYFIPMAPVITTACISIIPVLVVLVGVFPLLFFLNTYKTYKTFKTEKEMTLENIEEENKAQLREKMVLLNKEKIFLNDLKIKEVDLVSLKNSPLIADLKDVLKNRSFSRFNALFISFINGCFFPFFAGWLLFDGIKIILTYLLCPAGMALTSFTPIGLVGTAVIIGVSLLIGIMYGIYSSYKANQDYELKFNNIRNKVKVLCDEVPNRKVLNKSLCDYDRLLRRFADEQPLWTKVKKFLNRFMVCGKRLGTGSLFFRLILWTPITVITTASAPINLGFFPIILIMGIAFSAVVFMGWCLYAYNLESKMRQAGRLVEHLTQTEQLNCVDVELVEEGFGVAVLGTAHRRNSFHKDMEKIQNKSDLEKINNHSTLHSGLFVTTKHQSSGRDEKIGTSQAIVNVNAHY
ncbi:hypothetical protein [Rickettsiella grylli]|uniref:hypothetical protein n=1 Tax=Rickettsiella grylli TaxID=59196 RepID=UPI001F11FD70|nr:hypothetical protein [Rickettsiella grylli]